MPVRNRFAALVCTVLALMSSAPSLRALEDQESEKVLQSEATPVSEAQRKLIMAAAKGLKPEEVPELSERAEAGDAEAQVILGIAYEEGINVEKNSTEALRWIQEAAEQGHPMAQTALGNRSANGAGVPRDVAAALSLYQKAVDQGYSGAQMNLGFAYLDGIGVRRDAKEGAMWFRKAADQGDPRAQFYLAYLYDLGVGVKKNHEESARWYLKAAEQGHADSQFNLSVAYDKGEGVRKDKKESLKWLRAASQQGHGPATYFLGQQYWKGEVPGYGKAVLSQQMAMEKWEEAAERGYPNAALNLGELYSSRLTAGAVAASRDELNACMWFEVAKELDRRGDWNRFIGEREAARIRKKIHEGASRLQKRLSDDELAECRMRAARWLEPPKEPLSP